MVLLPYLKKTHVTVKSQTNTFMLENIPFLVTNQITKNLLAFSFNSAQLQIPGNIILADNTFNRPGPIDMLLGASVFWNLLCIGQIVLPNTGTILQKTKFGWILSGPLSLNSKNNSICNLSIDSPQNQLIHDQLEKFWKIEECTTSSKLSQEEIECEEHFLNTTTRDELGRFVVSLPIKDNLNKLGDSL